MQKNDYYKIAFFALLAAVIAGGVVYFWLSEKRGSEVTNLDSGSYITRNAEMFLCCQPTYFSIEVLDEYVKEGDFANWIEEKQFFTSENEYRLRGRVSVEIAGEKAYRVSAECGVDSPGNIILVNHDSKTYFINYHPEDCLPFSEKIVSSVEFL